MTEAEKISLLEKLSGEEDYDTLSAYLLMAEDKVLAQLYPYGGDDVSIPSKLEMTVIEIANFLINKRGAEGETRHSENGVDRTYSNADIPLELLRRITPMAGVL